MIDAVYVRTLTVWSEYKISEILQGLLLLIYKNNYMSSEAWDEITYPFPNFNFGNGSVISFHTL